MKFISHRGNLKGPSTYENTRKQITKVLKGGVDCEIDVRFLDNKFLLGHDHPIEEVSLEFLKTKNLWVHCKNLDCLKILSTTNINCFAHENDSYVLTSHNYIWTFYGEEVTERSVIVDLNKNWSTMDYNCYGVCSDYM